MLKKKKWARILMIDDEPVIRQVVESALGHSYDVRALASSEKLDETLNLYTPDVILLDVRMPEEDGLRICRRLRLRKPFDVVPIIFLSAFSDEDSMRDGFSNGGVFYIAKPFDVKDLVHVMEIFLGRPHRYPNG